MRGIYGPPTPEARPLKTPLGTTFLVDPVVDDAIASVVKATRDELLAVRPDASIVAYISTPLSARGGGYRPINAEISAFMKKRLETDFGPLFFALSPAEATRDLPDVGGKQAAGGEYLYMWSLILGGDDGLGRDFDMSYFVGPTDMAGYFGLPPLNRLGALYLAGEARATKDPVFRAAVWDHPKSRQAFILFYGGRASVAFSHGAHDEWNLFRLVNEQRASHADFGLGAQIAFYFDGRAVSLGDMNARAIPGYELV